MTKTFINLNNDGYLISIKKKSNLSFQKNVLLCHTHLIYCKVHTKTTFDHFGKNCEM